MMNNCGIPKMLSYVIPCYNSEKTIERVVEEIHRTMDLLCDYDYEIILVDDYSCDGVFSVIKDMALKDSHIKGFRLSKNFGQHAALMAGYRESSGDIIVSLDDDGQAAVSDVGKLLAELNNGYDAVFAKYTQKRETGFRLFGSKINSLMAEKLIGKPRRLEANSFFAMKRALLSEIIKYDGSYVYILGLILRVTQNISNVVIPHRERLCGTSGYNIGKLLALWINGFTAFSVKPLRIAALIGFIISIIGFIYGIYIVIHKVVDPLVPMGYSSLMAMLLFVSGIIMLILGMIGEYVGRIYINLNRSPQYVITKKTEDEKEN